jgi:hypothetical protein
MHPVEAISKLIDRYNAKKETYDPDDLVSMREDISHQLFLMSDFYSDIRHGHEAADYRRKRCIAEVEERLRGSKSEKTGRNIAREELSNTARLECAEAENDWLEAGRKYYKVKIMVDAVNQILNAISSRISLTK